MLISSYLITSLVPTSSDLAQEYFPFSGIFLSFAGGGPSIGGFPHPRQRRLSAADPRPQ